jgi:chromosome segregation ATPase
MRSFDKKGEVMIGILSSTNETMGSMNETMSSMNETMSSMNETLKSVKEDTKLIPSIKENTEKMLGKQDDTIEAIRGVSEKIDSGKEEIVTEISSLRGDLRSYMENKFSKIEQEIEGIKVKIGMT